MLACARAAQVRSRCVRMTSEDHLSELWKKVDAFFERVVARYPGALACASGCSDCCHRELTVTAAEAARIERAVRCLDDPQRARLARRARAPSGACVALEADGRCAIYPARPVVCRSHGVPIRYVEPGARGKHVLPMLDVCPKNFEGHDLATVDAACVLDQQTLSVLLGGIDALRARETGAPQGDRRELRALIEAATAPGAS